MSACRHSREVVVAASRPAADFGKNDRDARADAARGHADAARRAANRRGVEEDARPAAALRLPPPGPGQGLHAARPLQEERRRARGAGGRARAGHRRAPRQGKGTGLSTQRTQRGTERTRRTDNRERTPGTALLRYLPLLSICVVLLTLGVRTTRDLEWPADADLYRDIAQAQTIADGSLFGDPFYRDETVWH